MRKIGLAILSSTLLTPAQTNRWFKPATFTSNLNLSVGSPWEITRAPTTGDSVSWLYTKDGDIGSYSTLIALLPDYDIGFTVFAAGMNPFYTRNFIGDYVASAVVPTIQAAARNFTETAYAGTYADESSNSSMTLTAPSSVPGLLVTEWTANGTDILAQFSALDGVMPNQNMTIRLYYTGLTAQGGQKTSWRAVIRASPQPEDTGAFSINCVSWGQVNTQLYGNLGVEEFVFTVDGAEGKATAVENRVLGQEYTRSGKGTMRAGMRRMARVW